MAHDYRAREVIARSIWESRIAAARIAIGKITFDCSELPILISRMEKESETAQILIFSSFIEDKVEHLIKSHLLHLDSKKIEDDIFGSNGPLGTFGSRLALAYQLGWLSTCLKKKLDAFKKIRNEFAHNAFRRSFSDAKIASLFREMEYDIDGFLSGVSEKISGCSADSESFRYDLSDQKKVALGQLTLLAGETFRDFLVRPSAIAYQVCPTAILAEYESVPDNVKSIFSRQADIIVRLFSHSENNTTTNTIL